MEETGNECQARSSVFLDNHFCNNIEMLLARKSEMLLVMEK
jgi:hypothetical protein